MMAYGMNGYGMTRFPHPDLENGFREVRREEWKPADLLYYPGHVAMYIGEGKMIHASSTAGGVVIAEVDSRPNLLCAMSRADIL